MKFLTLGCTLDKCHLALNLFKNLCQQKISNKTAGVIGAISSDSKNIFDIKTQLNVNLISKKVVFLYFWPFLTIFHEKNFDIMEMFYCAE
jgi:hypothetical protein